MEVPESYICSITKDIMKSPVIDPDGYSYEKEAIIKWLEDNDTSPITRNPLKVDDLRPNRALKDSIELYLRDDNVEIVYSGEVVDVDITMDVFKFNEYLMISLKPGNNMKRQPCHICCIIDTSGSMDATINVINNDCVERTNLTQLDIVKHAVKTIIYSLEACDYISIVTFSNRAKVICKNVLMTKEGKLETLDKLYGIRTDGCTNLWDGLLTGMKLMEDTQIISSIFLLTDGMPNVVPPRGHIPTLKKYILQNGLYTNINTFGFGYNLDCELLNEISVIGNGSYCFIPDSSFIGTVFINTISNLLSTICKEANLVIETDALKPQNYCNYSHEMLDKGVMIPIQNIYNGQERNIIVEIYDNVSIDDIKVMFNYKDIYYNVINYTSKYDVSINDELVKPHIAKYIFINEIQKAIIQMNNNETPNIDGIIERMKEMNANPHLLMDIEGQVKEAFSREDWYKRWGKYYLYSLIRAHYLQLCNNFKDPGVQEYGSDMFRNIRDRIEDIYSKLPPPEGSSCISSSSPLNMSMFHNSNNACFHGNCLIRLNHSNSYKFVKNIKKGDTVLTPSGLANVLCVVKSYCKNNKEYLVSFKEGLCITQWHPILINGEWKYPATQELMKCMDCEAVYSLVLDVGHIVYINNIKCVTLGHGFKGDIVEHDYYGTQKVIDDLKKMKGWNRGLIELQPDSVIRNNKTQQVIHIFQP